MDTFFGRFGKAASLVAVAALIFVACGSEVNSSLSKVEQSLPEGGESFAGDSGAATDEYTIDAAAEEEAPAEPAESGGAEEPIGTGGADAGALQPTDIGRDIVFTAAIQVAVDDVVVAGQQALQVIEGVGGLLFGQETAVAETPRTVLTFKVPPEVFQTAVSRLGDVGVLTNQVITADDVTERVVDLESRIITAASSVERLRGFLAEATELETVAELERELLTRETDLELLRGQLRTLQGQVSLATITVTLSQKQPSASLAVTLGYRSGHDDPITGCVGDDDFDVVEGDEVTACIEVVNEGDVPVADLDVRMPDLDLELDDLTVVSGDPSVPLPPGQAIVFAAQFEAGPSVFGGVSVTARAVDATGADLGIGTIETGAEARLDVEQEVSLPGVRHAFATGWDALVLGLRVALLALAYAAPFFWLPILVWLGVRWMRRRRHGRGTSTPSVVGSAE